MFSRPRPAPNDASASAPRFASLSTSTCTLEPPRQLALSLHAGPAGQDHRGADLARCAGRSGRGAPTPAPTICESSTPASRPEQRRAARPRASIASAAAWSTSMSRAVLGEDGRGEVGQRDTDIVVVEVDADGDAGGRVEPEEHRRAAAPGLPLAAGVVLDDEALRLELGDEAAHRRPREAGQPRQVAAAREAVPAQRVDDENAVALAK